MRDTLYFAYGVAMGNNVNLRIRQPDTPFSEQAATWTLKYPYGLEGGVVQPTMTARGIESLLPIEQSGVDVMEETWNTIQEHALDEADSLTMITDTVRELPAP